MSKTYHDLSKEELVVKVVELTDRLSQLERLVFGSRHERFVPSTPQEQLALGLAETSSQAVSSPAVQRIEYTRIQQKNASEKVHTDRMKPPTDLPREQVIIEPQEDITGLKKIGEEITEELDRIPGKLFVSSIYPSQICQTR